VGLAGIFDNRDLVPGGDGADGVEVADVAAKVYRHDGARRGRDRAFQLGVVHLESLRIGVHKDRECMRAKHSVDGGDKGVGWDDDFVARFHAEHVHRDEESGRSVARGKRLPGAGERGERLLKLLDELPGAAEPVATAKDLQQGLLFGQVEFWPGIEGALLRLGAAEQCGFFDSGSGESSRSSLKGYAGGRCGSQKVAAGQITKHGFSLALPGAVQWNSTSW